MEFYKYEGLGNDFIILDDEHIDVVKMCDRNYGIGSDGIIVIKDINEEIIKIKIYNKDGSEASTCGNGLRCVGAFLYHKLKKTKFMIETMANIYEVKYIDNNLYQVRFNIPTSIKKENDSYIVDVGNIHLLTIKDIGLINFVKENQNKHDVNMEVVKIIDKDNIHLEIYERGVGETLACGSAAIAASSSLYKEGLVNSKVNCISKGGVIKVNIEDEYIYLIGPAYFVYKGEYNAKY